MSAQILDGKQVAKEIQLELHQQVSGLASVPGLATVLVGQDGASEVYVRNKHRACGRVGIESFPHHLPAETSQQELLSLIDQLNQDERIHGILVQLPLPDHLDGEAVLDRIDPAKDVDAFHPHNVGLLSQGRPRFLPCTPHGIQQLLHRSDIKVAGKHAVVLGRSDIVGKPMSMLLGARDSHLGPTACNATVTLCHSRSQNLADMCRLADIIVAAVGQPEFLRADMVKPGAVVVDVGIHRTDDGLVGDVAFDEVATIASHITPVPGGVGPLTVTMLLENTVRSAMSRG